LRDDGMLGLREQRFRTTAQSTCVLDAQRSYRRPLEMMAPFTRLDEQHSSIRPHERHR
jgi:hypothetical protein